jgi:hypothetical protein
LIDGSRCCAPAREASVAAAAVIAAAPKKVLRFMEEL